MTEETKKRLQFLFQEYLVNRISEQEYTEMWSLLGMEASEVTLDKLLENELQWLWEDVESDKPALETEAWDRKMERLMHTTVRGETGKKANRPRKTTYRRLALAASILFFVIAGIFYFFPKTNTPKSPPTRVTKAEKEEGIAPGGNKAVLILSNGARIILDTAANGTITKQGKTLITKSGSGQINYNQVNATPAEAVYNMLRTPRGGEFQIVLSDGTKVWLDAASTLRYPTSFSNEQRVVELTGEAYFEVAPFSRSSVQNGEARVPFIVKVDGMAIEVLGTHFNIMAYDDEPLIKTTLLEGSVKVGMENGRAALLKPGEQAQVNKNGEIQTVKKVNIDKAVAWKDNLFWFDEDNIHEVMRQVARWYDADVEIKGNIPQHFTGSIPRNVNVLRIFEVLQETGNIHFDVIGHKIIVTP